MVKVATFFVRGIDDQIQDNRRTAEMCYLMLGDSGVNIGGIDAAQANIGAGDGSQSPGEALAIAMEHRQCP